MQDECEVQGGEFLASSLPDPPIYTRGLKALDETGKSKNCTGKSDFGDLVCCM